MRPQAHVKSVVLYNNRDEDGDYIPLKIEVNNWVALQLEEPKRRLVDGAYKAHAKNFWVIDAMVIQIEV